MACVLRAGGTQFDVDSFLAASPWVNATSWKRGQPRRQSLPDGPIHLHSGFNLTVSEADFEYFERQIEESERFLQKYRAEVLRLIAYPGLDLGVELDFGVLIRDVAAQCNRFPASLVRIAGECGIELAITLYPDSPHDTLVP